MSDWGGENLRQDVRWKFGMPQVKNAHYVVALPGQLFFTTPIPVCLWFICRDKSGKPSPLRPSPSAPSGTGKEGEGRLRERRGQTLFIDARKMGGLIDRIHRELTAEEIKKISDCHHAWKFKAAKPAYADEPGFCKSVKLEDVLTAGRYVGAAEDDGEPFEQKMKLLAALRDALLSGELRVPAAIN